MSWVSLLLAVLQSWKTTNLPKQHVHSNIFRKKNWVLEYIVQFIYWNLHTWKT